MKKHLFMFLLLLVPLSGQRPEKHGDIMKLNPEAIRSQESSTSSVPRRLSYQGLLTRSNGQPMADRIYIVKFSLYKDAEGGTAFWDETQTININDGLISTTLGALNELSIIPSIRFALNDDF